MEGGGTDRRRPGSHSCHQGKGGMSQCSLQFSGISLLCCDLLSFQPASASDDTTYCPAPTHFFINDHSIHSTLSSIHFGANHPSHTTTTAPALASVSTLGSSI